MPASCTTTSTDVSGIVSQSSWTNALRQLFVRSEAAYVAFIRIEGSGQRVKDAESSEDAHQILCANAPIAVL